MIKTNDARVTKHIIIMSIICIVFAALHVYYGMIVLLVKGYIHAAFIKALVQLACGILFIIRKNPIFGAICTAMFVWARIGGGVTLLAIFIILLFVMYFAYVTYMSLQDWLERIGYYEVE